MIKLRIQRFKEIYLLKIGNTLLLIFNEKKGIENIFIKVSFFIIEHTTLKGIYVNLRNNESIFREVGNKKQTWKCTAKCSKNYEPQSNGGQRFRNFRSVVSA